MVSLHCYRQCWDWRKAKGVTCPTHGCAVLSCTISISVTNLFHSAEARSVTILRNTQAFQSLHHHLTKCSATGYLSLPIVKLYSQLDYTTSASQNLHGRMAVQFYYSSVSLGRNAKALDIWKSIKSAFSMLLAKHFLWILLIFLLQSHFFLVLMGLYHLGSDQVDLFIVG